MANTYTSLYYHIIFSTKHREPWLVKEIEERVWAFIGGIARAHNFGRNTLSSCNNTALNMMNVTCWGDSIVADATG